MRVWAIMLRQFYLLRESPARVLPLFAWVAVDIVLWGFLARYLGQLSGGHDWVGSLLGAVLLWDFFGRIMHGVATAFLEDVWSRNFLNVFASPITVTEYVSGLVLTSVATSLVGLLVMLLLATLGFGLNFLAYGLPLLPCLLILFLFGIALGVFASALVLRLGPASEWIIWPAHSQPAGALCRRLLSAFHPARLDALGGRRAAAQLCFRRHPGHCPGRGFFPIGAVELPFALAVLPAAGRPLLRPRLPRSGALGSVGPLQCRVSGLNTT